MCLKRGLLGASVILTSPVLFPVLSLSMDLERKGLIFPYGLHEVEVEFLVPAIDMQSTHCLQATLIHVRDPRV